MSDRTHDVLAEVLLERAAQDARWGEQNHPDGTSVTFCPVAEHAKRRCGRKALAGTLTFADILNEEFWEAMCEKDSPSLREELLQVAAVAVAWIEAIDRR